VEYGVWEWSPALQPIIVIEKWQCFRWLSLFPFTRVTVHLAAEYVCSKRISAAEYVCSKRISAAESVCSKRISAADI